MKGPYERLKYVMYRLWECPACGHHERTGGETVFMFCRCQRQYERRDRVCMKLLEDGVRRVDTPSTPTTSS